MSYKKFTIKPQSDVKFLKFMGLQPSHKVLDIGCGGGRLGYELITFLDSGSYYAFDKEKNWIKEFKNAVVNHNLGYKNPHIFLSNFDWKINNEIKFDYVYAYSVFTHVGPELIQQCLNNLKNYITVKSKFYATIIQGSDKGFEFNRIHPNRSGEYLQTRYDIEYFQELIKTCGYQLEIIKENCKIGPGNYEDATSTGNSDGHRIVLLKEL